MARHELTLTAVAGELMLTGEDAIRSVKTDLQMIEAGQVQDVSTPADLIAAVAQAADKGSIRGKRLA